LPDSCLNADRAPDRGADDRGSRGHVGRRGKAPVQRCVGERSPGSSTEANASGPQARRALTAVTELALVVLAPALH